MNAENPLVPELSVSDVAASLHFYRDLLGFVVVYDRPAEGFAFVERDGCQLMLDQVGLGRTWQTGPLLHPFGRGINLQLRVTKLDALLAQLEDNAVRLSLPVEIRAYEVAGEVRTQRQFCIQDPDGYLLRFCEQLA